MAFVAAAGLSIGVIGLAGEWLPPRAGLACELAVLAVVGWVYARHVVARLCGTRGLAESLREIAEEPDVRASRPPASGTASGDIRLAVDRLGRNVASLRQDKRRAEMVLANMADGIIAVDAEGRITLFNRAAGLIFGEKDARVLGRRIEDADLHPSVAQMAYECISTGESRSGEVRLPGHPQRAISIRAAPFRSAESGSDCAMIILHDLTEVRRHERNQKEFVSNVSHELKTPLTAVRTTAEALMCGAKNDDVLVDRFLNNILVESDRLSALIEDLMEIARMDSGVTRTERDDTDMAAVVNRAVSAVLPQARQKGVSVEIDVAEGLVAYCDEAQMVQVVRNLVDNAVKYTQPGGRVDVLAGEDDASLVVTVKDTGIGIPHGEIERVFERFYRVDKARSRRAGGTGLGLAIVKDIVESHGGRVDVETELGRGSTFVVTIPARDAEAG